VTVPKQKISHAIEIIIEDHGGDVQCLDGMKGRLHVLKKFLEAAGRPAEPMYIFEPVVEASLTGRRMSYDPSLAVELASGFDAKFRTPLKSSGRGRPGRNSGLLILNGWKVSLRSSRHA